LPTIVLNCTNGSPMSAAPEAGPAQAEGDRAHALPGTGSTGKVNPAACAPTKVELKVKGVELGVTSEDSWIAWTALVVVAAIAILALIYGGKKIADSGKGAGLALYLVGAALIAGIAGWWIGASAAERACVAKVDKAVQAARVAVPDELAARVAEYQRETIRLQAELDAYRRILPSPGADRATAPRDFGSDRITFGVALAVLGMLAGWAFAQQILSLRRLGEDVRELRSSLSARRRSGPASDRVDSPSPTPSE
jgi:hypothetical protein